MTGPTRDLPRWGRRGPAVLAALLLVAGAALLVSERGRPGEDAPESAVSGSPAPEQGGSGGVPDPREGRALAVLRSWDDARAAAFAAGDVAAVRALYVSGPAGRADARVLRSYAARGLVVRGLRMQLLRVDVLEARPRVLRLRVRDRVAVAVVQDRSRPAAHRALPRDGPTVRRLVLVRGGAGVAGGWRMRAVRPG